MEKSLNICHLYADMLNLYGDVGNVIVLADRARRRGIEVTVKNISLGERIDFAQFDLLVIGGGQDEQQQMVAGELADWRGADLRAGIEADLVTLAVCAGYQLLGQSYRATDGCMIACAGALDMHTVGGETRMIGDVLFMWEDIPVIGFENHSGKTYLGNSVQPLGKVVKGFGNNGEDGTEGARYRNVFGTYSHGPLLPKNPKLADRLLELALVRKYGEADLVPLDDTLENKAHQMMLERFEGLKGQ